MSESQVSVSTLPSMQLVSVIGGQMRKKMDAFTMPLPRNWI